MGTRDVLTDASINNAMVVHAAFGGSTNLLLHVPAIAHAAKLHRPTAKDWAHINRQVPRIVDALPNGPGNYATVQVFLAGGAPEVMLHLRRAGLLDTNAKTVTGETLNTTLDWWQDSPRRHTLRKNLLDQDGIDPDNVIMSPDRARSRGLTSTVCFPVGNLAPEGSVIKSTSIDPTLIVDEKYHHLGPAKVFTTEAAAIHAIKTSQVVENDVMVLICCGPAGAGMQEIYQITAALKALPFGKHVAVLTDARFSGVSTGACIGHISPEALAGGALGKIQNGDQIEITIDRKDLTGTVDFVGTLNGTMAPEVAAQFLAERGTASGPCAAPRTPGRHPSLGSPGSCQRRHLGRLRLRRRRNNHPPRQRNRGDRLRIRNPLRHINSLGKVQSLDTLPHR